MELLSFYNLQEVLEEYGKAVRNEYQDRLIKDDKLASGTLINSVEFLVLRDNQSIWVELHLEDYWKYVEYGRKAGKWPPINKIMDWIRIKPVLPRPMKNGALPTEKQLAFLISRKIGTEGIPAGNQLSSTIKSTKSDWETKIQEAITKDLDKSVAFILQKYFV